MKYRKFIFQSVILLVLLFSITAISAANLNDTDNIADISNNPKTYSDFYETIKGNTTKIDIENDYAFNINEDLDHLTGITIEKNLVINGNNHIIDCNNSARAFQHSNGNLEINNLIIKNGYGGDGSAIASNHDLTLNNVTFINCNGPKKSTTNNFGAVYSSYNKLNINNCKFIDNSGKNCASIYAYSSTATINNSIFTSSSANITKGHIQLEDSNLTVTNCSFSNTTSKYAAAIFGLKSDVAIYNTKFNNLIANKTAGAIALKLSDRLKISNCQFDSILSEKNAGAVFADVDGGERGHKGTVKIENTVFNNCYSEFGGAFLQLGGDLIIENSNFTSNQAKYDGGAIYTSFANVNISKSNFKLNSLIDEMSCGGATYFDRGNVILKENVFENNSGLEVSTIYAYDTNLTLSNNYFNNLLEVTSICTVFGSITLQGENKFNKDILSFNNTDYAFNIELSNKTFKLLNNTIPYTTLPSEFDLRNLSWVSPVKNQGFMGSCWVFGNVAAMESALLRYANNTYLLSENNLQNTMLQYSKYGELDSTEGATPYAAVAYVIDGLGIFPSVYDSYDELGKISSLFTTANDFHIHNVVVLPPRKNSTDNDLIKTALIKYGALAVSHKANFNNSYFEPLLGTQYYYGNEKADHTVCIVGWNDTYPKENFLKNPPGNGAWIVKNSWGDDWADEGYFYVSYYDTSIACYGYPTGYIITNDTYNMIYQNGIGGSLSSKDMDCYANIFTAVKDELIAAVGTYFNKAGTIYQLKIDVNDVEVYKQTRISEFSGYATIKLDKYVQIKKGDNFTVYIDNNKVFVSFDHRVHPQTGKSFGSTDHGQTWTDLVNDGQVAILKAYTVTDINITNSLVKYYGNDTQFVAKVGAGETVTFEFDGKNYTIIADENGFAKLPIDRNAGEYNITTTYNNISIVNYIKINSTIISSNVTRGYNSNYNYKIQMLTSAGKPLNNTKVEVSINNKVSKYVTDNSGYITIPFTKLTKQQTIVVRNPSNDENKSSEIAVKSRFSGAKNIAMYYYDGSKFKARIVGDNGKFVGKNQAVTIKLNKKTYKVRTDKNGYITLKIPNTVKPGKYTLKATYKGQTISKTVKVKQNLKTSKYAVKKSAKKLKVKATLKNGKTPLKGKKIILKVNGKTLKAKTSKKGIAQFTINKNVIKKLKTGKTYTMKVTYLKNTVKTILKVKR